MFNIVRKEIEWAGKKLIIETGEIARHSDGAVMVTYGETVVLCTACVQKEVKNDHGFFPLTVHYREMAFAAGKIPGGYFRREGKPSEKEVLVSRLIDRPIRPLFPANFHNEVQVICTVLSYDGVNDSDLASIIGASAALAISGAPFQGPIAAARIGLIDGNLVANPNIEDYNNSNLDLVIAGTQTSVLMVESEAQELTEEQMLEAVILGHNTIQPVIKMIQELASQARKESIAGQEIKDLSALEAIVNKIILKDLEEAMSEPSKSVRIKKKSAAKNKLLEIYNESYASEEYSEDQVVSTFCQLEEKIVREKILDKHIRIDGRSPDMVRPIVTRVSNLPKTHGSALFTRGETQAIVVTTLGSGQDEQMIDSLDGDLKQNFMLHYNFLPYSVGEFSPLRGTGRREIGHGKLAWRAIKPMLPGKDIFPYTIRCVSEITESNGSSSMATVCGASLSLMDAGVPLKKPVAGIAMGLIKQGEKFVVLSDILGDEDHLGDMDFKVAGTSDGITALQMDIKIDGITTEIMKVALEQAKKGREHILSKMAESISSARSNLSKNAPTITSFKINKDKIRDVIGSGGKVIREICEVSGAKVEIEDDGTISVAAVNQAASDKAIEMINNIVVEAEVGKIYLGKVVKLVEFGAFVNFLGNKDGLVHISEIANNRIEDINSVLKEGDSVTVKVIGFDKGKVRLSMKVVNQETGEDLDPENSAGGNSGQSNKDSKGNHKANKKKFF